MASQGGTTDGGNYIARQGDCIESIAQDHGQFWRTIWRNPNNTHLHQAKRAPELLLPGDRVFVPSLRPKEESGATEKRHKFRRKGIPSKLRIVLEDEEDRPRANLPFILNIDGELISGRTDDNGALQHPIAPNARKGKLTIEGENGPEEYDLQLGHVDPIDEISGIQARLGNLGHDCGRVDGKLDQATKQAIRAFQEYYCLPVSGEPDDKTKQKLKDIHES